MDISTNYQELVIEVEEKNKILIIDSNILADNFRKRMHAVH